ncbi:hypothetical protein PQX77_010323 [Marasmius sp. AFHP31]|nr:hypothetical protein PQX77_010323 [Marasmius sp. AFHP31]
MIGLITIRSTSLERYRSFAIGLLVTAAAGEAYWISTVGIPIPRDGREPNPVMWHDTLTFLRQLLFLFLPLIIHFLLPPSPPPITQDVLNTYNPSNPSAAKTEEVELPPALTIMHDLVNRVQLIRLARGAFARIGATSAEQNSTSVWARERQEGVWVREDEEVRTIAKGLGMNYDLGGQGQGQEGEGQEDPGQIGELRARARRAVGMLFRGFVPSGYWKVPPPAPAPSQG